MKYLIIIILFGSSVNKLQGQEKTISSKNQTWMQYYNQTEISENWTWLYDGGFRWQELFEESSQYIVRSGLGYDINDDVRVATGFANVGEDVNHNFFDQNRFMISPTYSINRDLSVSLMWNMQFGSSSNAFMYNYTNVLWLKINHKMSLVNK